MKQLEGMKGGVGGEWRASFPSNQASSTSSTLRQEPRMELQ